MSNLYGKKILSPSPLALDHLLWNRKDIVVNIGMCLSRSVTISFFFNVDSFTFRIWSVLFLWFEQNVKTSSKKFSVNKYKICIFFPQWSNFKKKVTFQFRKVTINLVCRVFMYPTSKIQIISLEIFYDNIHAYNI